VNACRPHVEADCRLLGFNVLPQHIRLVSAPFTLMSRRLAGLFSQLWLFSPQEVISACVKQVDLDSRDAGKGGCGRWHMMRRDRCAVASLSRSAAMNKVALVLLAGVMVVGLCPGTAPAQNGQGRRGPGVGQGLGPTPRTRQWVGQGARRRETELAGRSPPGDEPDACIAREDQEASPVPS